MKGRDTDILSIYRTTREKDKFWSEKWTQNIDVEETGIPERRENKNILFGERLGTDIRRTDIITNYRVHNFLE